MNYTEKIQRNSNDILIIRTDEEELFRKKFKDSSTERKCTICANTINEFLPHPALRVIVCPDCFQYYDNTVFLSNKDGTDKNCRWCAKLSPKYCCTSCTAVFCPDCLNRNFEKNYVDVHVKNNPEWKCVICNQKQLWALRAQCANADNRTNNNLDQSKGEEQCATQDDTASTTVSGLNEIPDELNKQLTAEEMAEARGIFLPSRKNFDRLIDKIKVHCTIFSAVTANRELKNAKDVFELTKKVSCMCRCIQDVITWIDDCNKNAYQQWFNKNISNNTTKEITQQISSESGSLDLLTMTKVDINKESRKTKTKEVLQSLRLKKIKDEPEETSGVSDNFMEFLDEIQDEIKQNKSADIEIKIETNSVFSRNTIELKQRSPEKKLNVDDSKTISIPPEHVKELENRILMDFRDKQNVEIKTREYLCDKTGDMFEGFEVLDSGKTTPNIFEDEFELTNDNETNDKNENIEDFFETDENSCDKKSNEKFSYSPDLMKLLNIEEESADTDDTGKKYEVEQEKRTHYKYLLESDCSNFSSMSSISSSSTTSHEDDAKIPVNEELNQGYIQTLDIANELQKLHSLPIIQTTKPPVDNKVCAVTCEVRLSQLDLNEYEKIPGTLYGYRLPTNKTISSNTSIISDTESSKKDTDDSESDINRLLNFKSLNKRKYLNTTTCSSSSSTNSMKPTKKKLKTKKKLFKSKSDCDSTASSSDDDKSNTSSDLLSHFEIPKGEAPKTNHECMIEDLDSNTDIDSDYLNDITSMSSSTDEDRKTNEKPKKKETKTKQYEKTETPAWKKDPLLTGRLDTSSSDKKNKTKNEIINDELLEQEETKYFEKSKNKTDDPKKIEDDKKLIILSDTSESDADSDIIFISNRPKREGDSPHKKGRRNIKKVLDYSELQTETQNAHIEEERRKERINMKNRSLDAVLSQSSLSEEDIGIVLDMDEKTKSPVVKIPHVLVKPLKPHQINGIKFMWNVCFESVDLIKTTAGAGCILAHCMGLGKTMQIVVLTHTLLTHKETGLKHVLILCPLSTVFNWCNEFKQTLQHAPQQINVYDLRSDKQKAFRTRIFEVKKWRSTGGVLIMGYDSFTTLVNEQKLNDRVTPNYRQIVLNSLINPGPDIVVCDEGHILKSSKTHKFTAINRVRTKRRILLTGTPLQNNLKEYWHMVSFVKPHLLGTYQEYANRFVNPIVNGQYEDSSPSDIQLMKKRSHVLHKKLQTTVHRYELSELKQYLPPKHEYVLFIQLSELQIKLYQIYLEKIKGKSRNLFQNFHDLQNIWTHPALLHHKYEKRKTYDEDYDPNLDPDTIAQNSQTLNENWYKDSIPSDLSKNINYGSKIVILFSIIRETCALGEKLLVFSSSIQELDLIEEFLKTTPGNWTKNADYYRMDGSVLPEKRMQYCNSFNDKRNKRARLFLISHRVGGLGLNLIGANRVVLMDVNWNPAYDTQSVFRVYRFGQEKPCFIYRLVSLGTMEELVYSRAVTKLAISCRVVDEQQIRRHFKEDDQHKLYKLNTDYLNQEPITPNLPSDRLLANLWGTHKPVLYNFKDHQSMLENLTHEELNEEEMKIAWEEFNREEELEKARIAQLANARELYKMQQPIQGYENTTLSFNATNKKLFESYSAGYTYNPNECYIRNIPNITKPINLDPPTTLSNAMPTARPIGNIIQNKKIIYQKQNEMIVPDILPNPLATHSNNVTIGPSTSAYFSRSNSSKKIYGNPKHDLPSTSKTQPQLLPKNTITNKDIDVDLLAKNGVHISPTKKQTPYNEVKYRFNKDLNNFEVINLE